MKMVSSKDDTLIVAVFFDMKGQKIFTDEKIIEKLYSFVESLLLSFQAECAEKISEQNPFLMALADITEASLSLRSTIAFVHI